jgi:hypothetical protein
LLKKDIFFFENQTELIQSSPGSPLKRILSAQPAAHQAGSGNRTTVQGGRKKPDGAFDVPEMKRVTAG